MRIAWKMMWRSPENKEDYCNIYIKNWNALLFYCISINKTNGWRLEKHPWNRHVLSFNMIKLHHVTCTQYIYIVYIITCYSIVLLYTVTNDILYITCYNIMLPYIVTNDIIYNIYYHILQYHTPYLMVLYNICFISHATI